MSKSFDPNTELKIHCIHKKYSEYGKINEDDILEFMDGLPEDQVNITDDKKHTMLYHAVFKEHVNVIRKLLEYPNIDINCQTDCGYTALMESTNRNSEIIKMLLEHPDIDVNILDCDGCTALDHAIGEKHIDNVKILINYPDTNINYQHDDGRSILHLIDTDNLDIAMMLLDHPDIDVNIQDNNGNTPLMHHIHNIICWGARIPITANDRKFLKMLHLHPKRNNCIKNKDGKTAFGLLLSKVGKKE